MLHVSRITKFVLVFSVFLLVFAKESFATENGNSPEAPFPLGPYLKEPDTARLALYFPVYYRGMADKMHEMRELLRSQDVFQITRNSEEAIFQANDLAKYISEILPENKLAISISGLGLLEQAAKDAVPFANLIIYNYEPNFPGVPEFSFNFSATRAAIAAAAEITRAEGRQIGISPTGRGVLGLKEYNWDYGILGQLVDYQQIQTQSYCKDDMGRYHQALEKLKNQYKGSVGNWSPQITIGPKFQHNGVSALRGYECTKEIVGIGQTSSVVWWGVNEIEQLKEYLIRIGRDPRFVSSESVVEGKAVADTTPSFVFGVFGPKESKFRYNIQISKNPDFSNLTVDYISDLEEPGVRTFTPKKELSAGIYYWRVKSIDEFGNESEYAFANGGQVAFLIGKEKTTAEKTEQSAAQSLFGEMGLMAYAFSLLYSSSPLFLSRFRDIVKRR